MKTAMKGMRMVHRLRLATDNRLSRLKKRAFALAQDLYNNINWADDDYVITP